MAQSAGVKEGAEFSTGARRNESYHDRLHRFRRAVGIAVVAWPCFALIDWFIVSFVAPGRLWFYLALRALGLLALLVGVLLSFGAREPSSRQLRAMDTVVSTILSVLITMSCLEFGGIASPLAMGVVIVLSARGFVFTDHWKRSILPVGLVVLSFPLTLLVMALAMPRIAEQFADSQAVAVFLLNLMFVTAAGAIAVSGSHLVWTLRRQLYQSRALGRYKLKKRIGAGGMGEIWLAHHHALRRDVAVKILRPENVEDPRAIARFEREVRATSELVHPNTVRVFDYGVTADGLWYYAMELLAGSDLHAEVEKNGVMQPERAVMLMSQASQALAEAHSRGIVHRDLKPENLFLTKVSGMGDFVKLLDFGLAKLFRASAESDENLTQVGWAVGTPQWVSPEIMLGEEADIRSDVFGLGAILYFLLCGESPYGEHDVSKVIKAHRTKSIKPPSQRLGRPIHQELERVVMKSLAKNPDDRYQTAKEFDTAMNASMKVDDEATIAMGPGGRADERPYRGAEATVTTEVINEPTPRTKYSS